MSGSYVVYVLMYLSFSSLRDDIGSILDWLNVVGESSDFTKNTVASLADAVHTGASCVPLEDVQNALDWRNREVHTYIRKENLQNIQIIPFRDVTAPLFNMHAHSLDTESAVISVDCSSFCFFPQLWQIVWYYLVDNVDHQLQ
jgi:hypothetical protein